MMIVNRLQYQLSNAPQNIGDRQNKPQQINLNFLYAFFMALLLKQQGKALLP